MEKVSLKVSFRQKTENKVSLRHAIACVYILFLLPWTPW